MEKQDIKGRNLDDNLNSYRNLADKVHKKEAYVIKGEELVDLVKFLDKLLSKGHIVTPLNIYDECEKRFKKVSEFEPHIYNQYYINKIDENIKAYLGECVYFYGKSIKSVIKSLKEKISEEGLNLDEILKIGKWNFNKTQNTYQYSRKGFSIFYDKAIKNKKEKLSFLNKKNELTKKSYLEFSHLLKTDEPLLASQIEGFSQEFINNMIEEMAKKKETLKKEQLVGWINKLNKLERNKVKGWEVDYIRILLLLTKEFESISKSIVYADLLIKYADFVYNYQTSGEVLPDNMNIEKYAKLKFLEAINIAIDNQNTEKHLLYLIKYIEFILSTLNYDELNNIFKDIDEIYKYYNKENNINIYQKTCYLRAKYLCRIGKYEESEKLFNQVYEAKYNLYAGDVNEKNVETIIELSDIINDYADLYRKINDYKKAMDLFVLSLDLRRKCAEINHEHYKSKVSASLYNISLIHMCQSSYKDAKKYILEAIEIDSILAEDHPEEYYNKISLSQDLIRLYDILFMLDPTDKDIPPLVESVKDINEELYEIDNARFKDDYCYALSHQAFILRFSGEFNKALEINEKILKIYDTEDRFIEEIISTNKEIAEIYVAKEEYKKADEFYLETSELLYKRYINDKTYDNFSAYIELQNDRMILASTTFKVKSVKKILSQIIAIVEDFYPNIEESDNDYRFIEFLNKIRFNLEMCNNQTYDEKKEIYQNLIRDFQDIIPPEYLKVLLEESSEENKQAETVDCEEEQSTDEKIKEVIKEGMDNIFGPN